MVVVTANITMFSVSSSEVLSPNMTYEHAAQLQG